MSGKPPVSRTRGRVHMDHIRPPHASMASVSAPCSLLPSRTLYHIPTVQVNHNLSRTNIRFYLAFVEHMCYSLTEHLFCQEVFSHEHSAESLPHGEACHPYRCREVRRGMYLKRRRPQGRWQAHGELSGSRRVPCICCRRKMHLPAQDPVHQRVYF